ncbi:MAG: hypothetical protein KF726_26150 [Anaerolineae bacterium]|nr:hypothetical protein [Anaerolineae bacterium]
MVKSIAFGIAVVVMLAFVLVATPANTPVLAGNPCGVPTGFSSVSYACPTPTPDAFVGPGIPTGWEFHYLSCSTAVFDKPAGEPVGDNAVWAGQSFYVNPYPKLDDNGKSWSQIFVSSVISPWIPTSCVK